MRPGETLGGWSLTSVQPREVMFKQGDRSEVLALQRPGGTNAPVGLPAPADGGGKLTMPTTASTTPFAPFVPRATPKNGESDGL